MRNDMKLNVGGVSWSNFQVRQTHIIFKSYLRGGIALFSQSTILNDTPLAGKAYVGVV